MKIYTVLLFVFSFSFVVAQNSVGHDSKIKPTKRSITSEISVFPNPAIDVFNIESKIKIEKVEIYSLIGKKIKCIRNLNGNSFEVSDLRNGIYLLRIFDSKKKVIKVQRLSINASMP